MIVLFCDDLSGALPAGELTGDDVIVVTSYLPTAADGQRGPGRPAGGRGGAGRRGRAGGDRRPARRAGLGRPEPRRGPSDSVSAPVLFGNDSYALSRGRGQRRSRSCCRSCGSRG